MTKWEDAYFNKDFYITTLNPSEKVKDFSSGLPPNSRVIDIGTGNGRNALYLASQGHSVDALDLADLEITKDAPEEIATKINFHKGNASEFSYDAESYEGVVMMRFLHYLPIEEAQTLLEKVFKALKPGGKLLFTYTIAGGSLDGKTIPVDTYTHEVSMITSIMENLGFKEIQVSEDNVTVGQHVPHKKPAIYAVITASK